MCGSLRVVARARQRLTYGHPYLFNRSGFISPTTNGNLTGVLKTKIEAFSIRTPPMKTNIIHYRHVHEVRQTNYRCVQFKFATWKLFLNTSLKQRKAPNRSCQVSPVQTAQKYIVASAARNYENVNQPQHAKEGGRWKHRRQWFVQ